MTDKIFRQKAKDEIAALEKAAKNNPKHQNDKKQVHAVSGLGITSMVGSAGAEAVELVGEQFVEVVGGGFGLGLIVFFICKFFTIEMEELAS